MGCHPDLQMYKDTRETVAEARVQQAYLQVPRKDLEFAFTVDNDSRCNVTGRQYPPEMHHSCSG